MFCEEHIETLDKLLQAKKFGDILSLPFPLVMDPIADPAAFVSFYSAEKYDLRGAMDMSGLIDVWPGAFSRPWYSPFRDAHEKVTGYEERLAKRGRGLFWDHQTHIFLSSVRWHGRVMHFDEPTAPTSIIFTVASSEGTRTVPHQVTHDIIARSEMKDILDTPINDAGGVDNNPQTALWHTMISFGEAQANATRSNQMPDYESLTPGQIENCTALVQQLEAAAKPTSENTLIAMAGISPHVQEPTISRERVFWRRIARPRRTLG